MRSTRVPARRSLRVGGVALIAAAALTGCQWTSTIQTDKAYEPADGTSVTVGGLHVANVVVVSAGKGAPGNVTGLAINNTSQPLQVQVKSVDGAAAGAALAVPAGGTAQLTTPGGTAMTLPSVPSLPGGHITLTVDSAEGQTAVEAPILAPTQYYAPYAPSGANPTGTATEGSTANPTEPGANPTEPTQPGATDSPTTAPAAPTATTAPAS